MTATMRRLMARRNDIAVKIDAQIAADAKIVAAYAGISLAEYLSENLREIVQRDLADWQARRSVKPPKASKRSG